MIIFSIQNPFFYNFISEKPLLRSFVTFAPKGLSLVKDKHLFVKLIDKIKLANGSYKTTRVDRFGDIDTILIEMLSSKKSYKIHDIAVSDGITSIELQKRLEHNNINHTLTISDKFSKLYFNTRNGLSVYYDEDGNILMASFLGIHINERLSWKYFLSKFLGILFSKTLSNKRDKESNKDKEILLLNPETREGITNGKIEFKYFDVFEQEASPTKYDIIRCMNILNPIYFNEAEIKRAIKSIAESLNDDGILIVGRTEIENNKNLASIFRIKNSQLVLEKQFNAGAEIENLVLSYNDRDLGSFVSS